MLNRKLHLAKWQVFFDNLSKTLQQDEVQRYVMLRVSTPEGLRAVAPWLEFQQISYDPAANTLHVRLDGFDYMIDHPVMIWAAVDADENVERLVILRHEGTRDYIEFSRHRFPYNAVPYLSRPGRQRLFRGVERENDGNIKKLWGRIVGRMAG